MRSVGSNNATPKEGAGWFAKKTMRRAGVTKAELSEISAPRRRKDFGRKQWTYVNSAAALKLMAIARRRKRRKLEKRQIAAKAKAGAAAKAAKAKAECARLIKQKEKERRIEELADQIYFRKTGKRRLPPGHTPQPGGRPPKNMVWDTQSGGWVDPAQQSRRREGWASA
jgi:hypothetical protein